MQLIEKLSQHRRDFKGRYKCQNCLLTIDDEGLYSYDDDNFHDNVIPNMKCKQCKLSTNDLGIKNERTATKYKPYEVI